MTAPEWTRHLNMQREYKSIAKMTLASGLQTASVAWASRELRCVGACGVCLPSQWGTPGYPCVPGARPQ